MSEKIRRHYIFHGEVQGVAFRYRSREICMMLGLTGWVRNLYDGTVEMEAQGTVEALREMVRRISEQRYIYITGIEQKDIPVEEDERSFRITG